MIKKASKNLKQPSLLDAIGDTPIIRLQRLSAQFGADIYVKLEFLNPGGSHKVRVALRMIQNAIRDNVLVPHSGQTIIEPTGGNTGTGLAIVSALFGFNVLLVIPDNFSKFRRTVIKTYGAEVILSDSSTGNDSHIEKAIEMRRRKPDYVFLDQFTNPANMEAHAETTAQEIMTDLPNPDYFIGGIGSGGSLFGIGRVLKDISNTICIIAVQPDGCDFSEGIFGPHKLIGTAVGIVPKFFDSVIIDDFLTVSDKEAIDMMRNLPRLEGISVGISSAANIVACCKVAASQKKGCKILTIAYDSGDNYLDLFSG